MKPLVRLGRSFVHRNGLGQRHLEAMAAAAERVADSDRPVTIFYGSGTKAHKEDAETILLPAIQEIDRMFEARVRFVIAGYPPSLTNERLSQRVYVEKFVTRIEKYWEIARSADIALSVLKPTAATDAKSEIKWLEAAMFSIPAVVSPTETFAGVIADGENGLLAADSRAFVDALNRLVSNPTYRAAVGAAAFRKVQAEYSPQVLSANIAAILASVQRPRSSAIRVLVVNVFYAPQAIGGATRVVIDNIRDLRALYGNEFEFEVFTTVEGGADPYAVNVYAHEGVRVTAMTASERGDVDRRALDPGVDAIFRRCVERFAPDLIHFHCIQRITATATEVAQSLDVPYVITAHDGWWICDSQFLHDEKDLVAPYDFRHPRLFDTYMKGRSLARPADLLPSLRGAAAILAVSEPFANIYQATGLDNVRTISNGLPDVIAEDVKHSLRRPSVDGKVRLGHVGGLEMHKGFPLLKRALQVVRPNNITLVAVDPTLSSREVREEFWGNVRVRFVARRPQSEVVSLYETIDVLFAPSLWPESYGLVTREAVAAGCWVVASDRGAIAEPVVEGVNGHIVSVDDLGGLIAVLRAIDADPERYAATPPVGAPMRSSADQARDLATLYRELAKAD